MSYIECESVTAMKEKVGEVFSIAKDNQPVTGCTISKEVHSGGNYIIYFSLAKNTDISAEIYPYHKLIIIADGSLDVFGTDGCQRQLAEGGGSSYTDRYANRYEDSGRRCLYRNLDQEG